jgi:hypothetical protein
LRALQGRGTLRVPDIGREASRPYKRNHRLPDFYEFIKNRIERGEAELMISPPPGLPGLQPALFPDYPSAEKTRNPHEKIKENPKNADLKAGKKKREVDHGRLVFRRGFYLFLRFRLVRAGLQIQG